MNAQQAPCIYPACQHNGCTCVFARAALAAAPAAQAAPEFSDAAWALAQKVRADLDRQSCPGVYMDIAMESIARNLAAAPVQADAITVNLVRLAGLDKHKARECEQIVRAMLAAPAAPQVPAVQVGRVYRYGSDSKGLAWHGIYWNHAGVDLPDGTPLYAGAPPASPSAAPQPAERARCAAWVDARRSAFCEEHGSIDPDTGALEFGRGAHAEAKAEYVGELEEIAAGLRALKPNA